MLSVLLLSDISTCSNSKRDTLLNLSISRLYHLQLPMRCIIVHICTTYIPINPFSMSRNALQNVRLRTVAWIQRVFHAIDKTGLCLWIMTWAMYELWSVQIMSWYTRSYVPWTLAWRKTMQMLLFMARPRSIRNCIIAAERGTQNESLTSCILRNLN